MKADFFSKYFLIQGRFGRGDIWKVAIAFLLFSVVACFAFSLARATGSRTGAMITLVPVGLMYIAFIAAGCVANVKRLHDFNLSGWCFLPIIIGEVIFSECVSREAAPLLGVLVNAVLLFVPGTKGPNDHGPDPRGEYASRMSASTTAS